MQADSVWTKRECRNSDRVDKPGATRCGRVAPTLPTLRRITVKVPASDYCYDIFCQCGRGRARVRR